MLPALVEVMAAGMVSLGVSSTSKNLAPAK